MREFRMLESWYDKAGVRGTARRTLAEDEDIQKDFFPQHLVPHLNHPDVVTLQDPLRRYLNAQHLYQWLNFTAEFELAVVCRATREIVDNACGLQVPRGVRMDALKILVDENYHALYSVDVVEQIETRSGIAALGYDFRPFLARLDAAGDAYPEHRRLVQLLQVVVFETLITSIIADIPQDRRVITLVRETVRDHAIDEGRHHAYFAEFFKQLWGQLDPADRRLVARLLPDVIVSSLQPATQSAGIALQQVGFSVDAALGVVAESYDRDSVLSGIRSAAAKTIGLLTNCGVLDLPGARDGFAEAGLLLP